MKIGSTKKQYKENERTVEKVLRKKDKKKKENKL